MCVQEICSPHCESDNLGDGRLRHFALYSKRKPSEMRPLNGN